MRDVQSVLKSIANVVPPGHLAKGLSGRHNYGLGETKLRTMITTGWFGPGDLERIRGCLGSLDETQKVALGAIIETFNDLVSKHTSELQGDETTRSPGSHPHAVTRTPLRLPAPEKVELPQERLPWLSLQIGDFRDSLPIKILARSREFLKITAKRLPGNWKPPPGFDNGYEGFRRKMWDQTARSSSRPLFNGLKFHVASVRCEGENAFEFHLQNVDYMDDNATSRPKSLNEIVQCDDGSTRTVANWLSATWILSNLRPYPSGANVLTTNVLLVTKDDEAVISQQGRGNNTSEWIWASSSSGTMDARDDVEDGIPALWATAQRETKEEIGVHLAREEINWLAAIVRFDMGWFAALAEAKSAKNRADIQALFNKPREDEEVRNIAFVPLNPAAVADFLQGHKRGKVLPLHLALALWRRGYEVKIG